MGKDGTIPPTILWVPKWRVGFGGLLCVRKEFRPSTDLKPPRRTLVFEALSMSCLPSGRDLPVDPQHGRAQIFERLSFGQDDD